MSTKTPNRTETREAPEPEGIQSVEKALAVLDALADGVGRYPMTLAELTRRVGLHRSSVNRCIASLVRVGYVQTDPATQRYQLGPKVLRLSQQFLRHSTIASRAQRHLCLLRDLTGETAFLSLLVGDQRVVVAQEESYQGLRRSMEIGIAWPLHCSGASKAILAFAPEDLVERVLSGPLPKCGPGATTDPAVIRAGLDAIRDQGYAIGQNEVVEGAGAACAPVFDYRSQVVGSLGIAVPLIRFGSTRQVELGSAVRESAVALSRELGFTGQRLDPGASG